MKTMITAASFALIVGLSSVAHAGGFSNRSQLIDTTPSHSSASMGAHGANVALDGFQQRSNYVSKSRLPQSQSSISLASGEYCDLTQQAGFQNSSSVANC